MARHYFNHTFSSDDVEQFIIPRIESLADPESVDDLRTDAVTVSILMFIILYKQGIIL